MGNKRILKFINSLNYTIKNIGKLPICNAKSNRAPHIGKFCFILCWRCSAIIGIILLCQCVWILVGEPHIYLGTVKTIIFTSVLITPLAIDGMVQHLFKIESTNLRRIITGIMAGFGLWFGSNWLFYIFHF